MSNLSSSSSSKYTVTGGISPLCQCDISNSKLLPKIKAAPHPYNNTAVIVSLKENQQISPYFSENSLCEKKITTNGKLSLRYHLFSHGVYVNEVFNTKTYPDGYNDNKLIRDVDLDSIKVIGYNKCYGDQPGYSNGREITVESGKIERGILNKEDVFEEIELSFKYKTIDSKDIVEINGCSNRYINSLIFYYDDIDYNENQDFRFHILFRLNIIDSKICNSVNLKNKDFYSQESIIDNIGVVLSKDKDKKPYIRVDTRYHIADFIQIIGSKINFTKIKAICIKEDVYKSNVVFSNNFSVSFDSLGRLFVFYEDRSIFSDGDCECPSSSSSSSFSSSSSSSSIFFPTLPGGGGGGGGNGFLPGGGGGSWSNPFPIGYGSSSSSTVSISSSSSSSLYSSSSSSSFAEIETCFGPDNSCNNCSSKGKKNYNSFTVYFSGFSKEQLCKKCISCDGDDGFFYIDKKYLETSFCIMQDCYDPCKWENIVYIPVISKKCKNISCDDDFHKILVPMKITILKFDKKWEMTADIINNDCDSIRLFSGVSIEEDECNIPSFFYSSENTPDMENDSVCCLCLPEIKEISNISVLMSPDMGNTWYDFKGIIRTTSGEIARKPYVVHDKFKNNFHLFYILQGQSISGLFHKTIDSSSFDIVDSFKEYHPIESFDESSDDDSGLLSFSKKGQNIRKSPSDIISGFLSENEKEISRNRFKNGKSYRFNINKTEMSFAKIGSYAEAQKSFFFGFGDLSKDTTENIEYSSYIDSKGKIYLYYYEDRGTLPLDEIDDHDIIIGGNDIERKLLISRISNIAPCGNYTLTISGIEDYNCECFKLNGTIDLNKKSIRVLSIVNGDIAYETDNWKVWLDDRYWIFKSKNEMLTFRTKRNSNPCPPAGKLELVCNKCSGNPSASIDITYGYDGISSSSSSIGTIRPFDALINIFSSNDEGKTWIEEPPARGGHFGSLAYDYNGDFLYSLYISDNMLFARRYPSFMYKPFTESQVTKKTYEISLIPIDYIDFDYRSSNIVETVGTLENLESKLSEPIQYNMDLIITKDTTAQPLNSEKDINGMPVFLSGEKNGNFYPPAEYPYPSNFIFDKNITVGETNPACYITPNGALHFFYVDLNGNINGGYLLSNRAILDIKLKPI